MMVAASIAFSPACMSRTCAGRPETVTQAQTTPTSAV